MGNQYAEKVQSVACLDAPIRRIPEYSVVIYMIPYTDR